MSAVPRPTDFELIHKAFDRTRVSYQELSGRSCTRKVGGWRPCCMTANYTLDGEAICSSHAAQQARKELAEAAAVKPGWTPGEPLPEGWESNADVIETMFLHAVAEGDAEAVGDALRVMLTLDVSRAVQLYDDLDLALRLVLVVRP